MRPPPVVSSSQGLHPSMTLPSPPITPNRPQYASKICHSLYFSIDDECAYDEIVSGPLHFTGRTAFGQDAFNKVPDFIIQDILVSVVDDAKSAASTHEGDWNAVIKCALNVFQVDRRFYYIAIETAHLWTVLLSTMNKELSKLFLERSRNSSVTIVFAGPSEFYLDTPLLAPPVLAMEPDFLWRVANLHNGRDGHRFNRIQSIVFQDWRQLSYLRLVDARDQRSLVLLEEAPWLGRELSFPSLLDMHFDGSGGPPRSSGFFHTMIIAPRLLRLNVRNVFPKLDASALKALTIVFDGELYQTCLNGDFCEALNSFPRLTKLDLIVDVREPRRMPQLGTITLFELTDLLIEGSGRAPELLETILTAMKLPKLKKVVLKRPEMSLGSVLAALRMRPDQAVY